MNDNVSIIVYSMNRAMQLHLFLTSIIEKTKPMPYMYIIYRTTDEAHEQSYNELLSIWAKYPIKFIKQNYISEFRPYTLECFDSIKTDKMFFACDDDVFINDIDFRTCLNFNPSEYIFTLRLGTCLTKCYTRQCDQKLPLFKDEGNGILSWEWSKGDCNWNYPLSVNEFIFSTKEIKEMLNNIMFTAPNPLEATMQKYFKDFVSRKGLCFNLPVALNLPVNKVQTANNNVCGHIHQDFLLSKWQEGLQIDGSKIYGIVPESAHQEIDFSFIKRGQIDG